MKFINSALLGVAVLSCVTASANAADVEVYGDGGLILGDEVPYVAQSVWTGFYVGGSFGASFGSILDDEQRGRLEVDNGAHVSAHIGYNWESPSHLVYGVEADMGIIDDEFQGLGITDHIASLRGRLGYNNGSSMVYGTGGLAYIGYDQEFAEANVIGNNALGFAVGVGWEHKLLNNFGIGLEGNYYSIFGEDDQFGDGFDHDFWVIRARASYYIDGFYGDQDPLK